MLTNIMLVTLYVRDQDQALGLYTGTLGLEKRIDAAGPEGRFLTVGVPGTPRRDRPVAQEPIEASDTTVVPNGWNTRYAARRIAWHVLEHTGGDAERGDLTAVATERQADRERPGQAASSCRKTAPSAHRCCSAWDATVIGASFLHTSDARRNPDRPEAVPDPAIPGSAGSQRHQPFRRRRLVPADRPVPAAPRQPNRPRGGVLALAAISS
ncbi:MAG TPA: hypothetical protein VGJ86_03030 [Acidimicrobiales bacterium]